MWCNLPDVDPRFPGAEACEHRGRIGVEAAAKLVTDGCCCNDDSGAEEISPLRPQHEQVVCWNPLRF